jgi:hypothetical protein
MKPNMTSRLVSILIVTFILSPRWALAECEDLYREVAAKAGKILKNGQAFNEIIPSNHSGAILSYKGQHAVTWEGFHFRNIKGQLSLTVQEVAEQNQVTSFNAMMVADLLRAIGEIDYAVIQFMGLQLVPDFPTLALDSLVHHALFEAEEDLFCKPGPNGEPRLWTWREIRQWLRVQIRAWVAANPTEVPTEVSCKPEKLKGETILVCESN